MSSEEECPVQVDIENLIEKYKSILVNGNLSERERLLYKCAIKREYVLWKDAKMVNGFVSDKYVAPDMLDKWFLGGILIITCENDALPDRIIACMNYLDHVLGIENIDLIITDNNIRIDRELAKYIGGITYDINM
jgi:hypothetical protein